MKHLYLWMICLVFAFPAQAQEDYRTLGDKIHFKSAGKDAAALLQELQARTEYTFSFDNTALTRIKISDIDMEDVSLGHALQYLHNQYGFLFSVSNRNISVQVGPPQQQVTGRVNGRVLDDQTNDPVIGASIQAGSKGTVTDISGRYELELPVGSHTLTISSIGYTPKKITDVEIKRGVANVLPVSLGVQKGTLKVVEVVATARKESVNALYLRQKNNMAITDGISAEQIGRSSDKNVGEVLKRVSGLATVENKYVVVRGLSERYNQAMLNGQVMPSTELNRKNFSYDIIPSNVIDNITVIKTITPDMSAEFGGGLINVETKAIPMENFLTLTAGVSGNDKTTGRNFRSLQLEGREYFGQPSKHRELFGKMNWNSLGDILKNTKETGSGGTLQYNIKEPSRFANNWGVYQFEAQPSQNYQASWGRVVPLKGNRQLGFMASASYRNTLQTQDVRMSRDGFDIGTATDPSTGKTVHYEGGASFSGKQYGLTTNLGGLAGVGYTSTRHRLSLQSLYLNLLDQQLILGKGIDVNNQSVRTLGYYDNTQWTRLWQNQLKGEHAIGKKGIKISWMGAYVQLNRQRPDNHNIKAQLPDDKLKTKEYTIAGGGGAGTDGALRWWTRAFEHNLSWDANVAVPFRFNIGKGQITNTFKAGYAGWSKDRLFYVARTGSVAPSGPPSPLKDYYSTDIPGFHMFVDRFSDDFHRTANLHAGYAMLDHKILDKVRLVWGVRGEYYNLNKVNAVLDEIVKEIKQRPGSYDLSALYNREKDWHFFPSANLTYSLTPKMNFRLAYAKSIIRPDLRELAFFREYDFELGGEYTSQEPLVSTKIEHVDFRYEYYPGPGEVLSLSLFYKKFDRPMEVYGQQDIRLYYLRNNYRAENRGIEVELRKSFAFTNVPVLRNITLYGNGTILFTRVRTMVTDFNFVDPNNSSRILPRETIGPWEKRPQAGSSNYMVNAGLYYDTKPVSFTLLYNYVTNRVFQPALVYPQSLFERPLEALDAQVAVRFLKQKAQVSAGVSNLLNSYLIIYRNRYNDQDIDNGKKEATVKQQLYQPGQDDINYEARPGRTFSLTLTYRF